MTCTFMDRKKIFLERPQQTIAGPKTHDIIPRRMTEQSVRIDTSKAPRLEY